MRRARRFVAVVLGCVLALVLFEGVLQVVALSVYVTADRPDVTVRRSGQYTVLCVGDSFTYGLGATDSESTYPHRLQRRLAAVRDDCQVVNCGWPGSTSEDLLRKLPWQLSEYAPDVVYVLVGCNDCWREPKPLLRVDVERGSRPGFRWELRTLRLCVLIGHWLGAGAGPAGGPVAPRADDVAARPAFLGEWHGDGVRMSFSADRRVETHSGHLNWSLRGGGELLVLHDPTTNREISARWELDDGRLVLDGDAFAEPLRLVPGPAIDDDADRAARALREGRLADAERLYRNALEQPELRAVGCRGLVDVLSAQGRTALAREEVERLRAEFTARPDPETGHSLIDCYFELGDRAAAAEIVADMLVHTPVTPDLMARTIKCGLDGSDGSVLTEAVDRALHRDDLSREARVLLHESLAFLRGDDPVACLAHLIEAFFAGGDEERTQGNILHAAQPFTAATLERALERVSASQADRDAFRRVFAGAARRGGDTTRALAANLRQVVERCRDVGAVPVLMTYPNRLPEVEAAVVPFAKSSGVDVIRLGTHFDELSKTVPRRELFVLDGHCNDRGYDVIAELVAADVLRRMR